jgi:hypothetical protein
VEGKALSLKRERQRAIYIDRHNFGGQLRHAEHAKMLSLERSYPVVLRYNVSTLKEASSPGLFEDGETPGASPQRLFS